MNVRDLLANVGPEWNARAAIAENPSLLANDFLLALHACSRSSSSSESSSAILISELLVQLLTEARG